MTRSDHNENGVALILAIVLTLVAAAIGGSLMLLAQTETYSSLNYRLMTQARYAAESGVHRAVNHLLYSYTPPAPTGLGVFDNTVSPVRYNGQPVVLSARSGVTANHPTGATQSAFNTAAHGTLTADQMSLEYAASATLMSVRAIDDYGAATKTVIETWEISSEGTVPGARPATVEVSAVLERHVIMVSMFGLFATGQTCAALSLGGGVMTDSYDSSNMTFDGAGRPVTSPSFGNLGTNGNLTLGGTGSVVNGSLSTPRSGVGNCNTTGAALTMNGGATVTEGIDQMPQPITFPPPAAPNPMPPTTSVGITKTTTCASLGLSAPTCTGTNGNPTTGGLTINPNGSTLVLGDISLTSGAQINFLPGTYHINSFSTAGNSVITLPGSTPVIFNVAGVGQTTPIDFTGSTVSNPSYKSQNFQIQYGGTGTIKLSGGSATALMLYAPLASAQLTGGSDFYGSILAKQIDVQGGTQIHYDRHSPANFGTAGNFMLSSFTWKKS
jgi:hypothetical protein